MRAVPVPLRHNKSIRRAMTLSEARIEFSPIEDSYVQLSFLKGVTLEIDARYVIGEQELPVPSSNQGHGHHAPGEREQSLPGNKVR